jgi:hypothetical protein
VSQEIVDIEGIEQSIPANLHLQVTMMFEQVCRTI